MPFSDVINNYASGATGTLTDVNGAQVGYTVTGTSPTVDWNALQDGARVNANGTESFTVTFENPVVGAAIRFSGGDANERYFITIDGVTVNLNTLIANGDAIFTETGAKTYNILPSGGLSGGRYTDGSVAELVFTIPITSIGAFGTNGNAGNWDFVDVGIDPSLFNVVCFTTGTLIETATGPRPVQELKIGDILPTAQNGLQAIRWIGSRRFSAAVLREIPRLRPVRIMAGALGHGLPRRDLVVSRQHRIVVSSPIAKRMFGIEGVMIPAIKLTGLPGIHVEEDARDITYFHILLDAHEAILAEGTLCESLYLGDQATAALDPEALKEVLQIFPRLAASHATPPPAMLIPQGKLQTRLLERHAKNHMPLQRLEIPASATRRPDPEPGPTLARPIH